MYEYFTYKYYECMYVCVYTMYVPGALGSQKRTSDPPKLELQVFVRCRVGGC